MALLRRRSTGRHRRAVLLVAAFAVGFAASPRPAAARMAATLEFGPGVSIPLTRYIDVSGDEGHHRVDNGVHAALNLSILFGNWQFRYAANWISLGTADIDIPDQFHQDYQDVQAFLGEARPVVGDIVRLPEFPAVGKVDADSVLAFHSFTFGYRFYFLRGMWQPYVPVELGAVVVASDYLSRTIFGFAAATGIGLDVNVWGPLYLGAQVRYHFYLTETDQSVAAIGLLAQGDIFDASVAFAHVIAATVHIQARY